MATTALAIVREVRRCTVCADELPLEPRPLLAARTTSRILIIGQAPGTAAHETGIPWDDRSGVRLRDWMGIEDDQFYDDSIVALMPMGFCYPGKGKAGDSPPRPECAPLWHHKLLRVMKSVQLTLYVGKFAFSHYLGEDRKSLAEAVRDFDALLPDEMVLPHPSPRNNIWLKKNDWYEKKAVPALRRRIKEILG
jgi:uracil-DNA glycosylase